MLSCLAIILTCFTYGSSHRYENGCLDWYSSVKLKPSNINSIKYNSIKVPSYSSEAALSQEKVLEIVSFAKSEFDQVNSPEGCRNVFISYYKFLQEQDELWRNEQTDQFRKSGKKPKSLVDGNFNFIFSIVLGYLVECVKGRKENGDVAFGKSLDYLIGRDYVAANAKIGNVLTFRKLSNERIISNRACPLLVKYSLVLGSANRGMHDRVVLEKIEKGGGSELDFLYCLMSLRTISLEGNSKDVRLPDLKKIQERNLKIAKEFALRYPRLGISNAIYAKYLYDLSRKNEAAIYADKAVRFSVGCQHRLELMKQIAQK